MNIINRSSILDKSCRTGMPRIRQLAITLVALSLLIQQSVHADTNGVEDPTFWDRGDTDTGYIVFDDFDAVVMGAPPNTITTISPTTPTDSMGGLTGTVTQTSNIEFPGQLLGPPGDTAVYLHMSPANWTMSIASASFDVNYLQLQIKEVEGTEGLVQGQDDPTIAVLANGEAADIVNVYDDGKGNLITSFYWELDSTIAAGTSFDITLNNVLGGFDTYDSFSIDVANATTALPQGDANGNGEFNNQDIAAFVLALTDANLYGMMYPSVDPDVVLDMNGDGSFNNKDVAAFVAALTGP